MSSLFFNRHRGTGSGPSGDEGIYLLINLYGFGFTYMCLFTRRS